ncbi:MAG: CPBP family intramembrane glutamic endopeptidase [Candidatus Eisenbacteria bacterium]
MDDRPTRRVVLPVFAVILFWTGAAMLAQAAGAHGWKAAVLYTLIEAAMLLGLVSVAFRAGYPLRRVFGPRPSSSVVASAVASSIPLLALELGIVWALLAVLSRLNPSAAKWVLEISTTNPFAELGTGPLSFVFQTIFLAVLVPITEELAFRGLLFGRLAERWGTLRALLLTSALFAILHLDPIGKFAFAFVCGLLYLGSGSLWAPIALHAANNFFALAIPDVDVPDYQPGSASPGGDWLGAVFLISGVVWFILFAIARRNLWHRLPAGSHPHTRTEP